MSFHFDVDVKPFDFFKMSMKKTYGSPVGVCNFVFTAGAVVLTVKFFSGASDAVQTLLILMCLLFPVIQPLSVYMRAKNVAARVPKGLVMDVDGSGITVSVGPQSEQIAWNRVSSLFIRKDMLVISLDDGHGYFLTDSVLKDKRNEFKDFVLSRIQNR